MTISFLGKQVVIARTLRSDSEWPLHYEWLFVYTVNDAGSVEFVTKFRVDNQRAMVYNEYGDYYAPPNLLLASRYLNFY